RHLLWLDGLYDIVVYAPLDAQAVEGPADGGNLGIRRIEIGRIEGFGGSKPATVQSNGKLVFELFPFQNIDAMLQMVAPRTRGLSLLGANGGDLFGERGDGFLQAPQDGCVRAAVRGSHAPAQG